MADVKISKITGLENRDYSDADSPDNIEIVDLDVRVRKGNVKQGEIRQDPEAVKRLQDLIGAKKDGLWGDRTSAALGKELLKRGYGADVSGDVLAKMAQGNEQDKILGQVLRTLKDSGILDQSYNRNLDVDITVKPKIAEILSPQVLQENSPSVAEGEGLASIAAPYGFTPEEIEQLAPLADALGFDPDRLKEPGGIEKFQEFIDKKPVGLEPSSSSSPQSGMNSIVNISELIAHQAAETGRLQALVEEYKAGGRSPDMIAVTEQRAQESLNAQIELQDKFVVGKLGGDSIMKEAQRIFEGLIDIDKNELDKVSRQGWGYHKEKLMQAQDMLNPSSPVVEVTQGQPEVAAPNAASTEANVRRELEKELEQVNKEIQEIKGSYAATVDHIFALPTSLQNITNMLTNVFSAKASGDQLPIVGEANLAAMNDAQFDKTITVAPGMRA